MCIGRVQIMLGKFYPYEYAPDVYSINYDRLYDQGFRGIVFDIDNTLVHHGDSSNQKTDEFITGLQRKGFKILLLTDNDEERVLRFTKNIDTPYICDAGKPSPDGFLKALDKIELPAEKVVCIGDQIFKDILGANRAGIPNILVHFITALGEKKIGKRRYLEFLILFLYRHDKKSVHRLGDIL